MLSVTELSMAAQALRFQASVLDQVKLSPFPTAADMRTTAEKFEQQRLVAQAGGGMMMRRRTP